jgi:hypothetical protein
MKPRSPTGVAVVGSPITTFVLNRTQATARGNNRSKVEVGGSRFVQGVLIPQSPERRA